MIEKAILIIEDDEAACRALCAILRSRGFHAVCAAEGKTHEQ